MQTAKETGSKAIQATDRVFLFIQPEQMASMHSCLASCASRHIRCLFSSSGPTHGALAPLAHAVMHGCICVLTIMCGVWWMEAEGEISRVRSWYKNQQRGCSREGGGFTVSPPNLPSPSIMPYSLVPFPSTSPTQLLICPLSTSLSATPITVLLTSPSPESLNFFAFFLDK